MTYEVFDSLRHILTEKTYTDSSGFASFNFNVKKDLAGDFLAGITRECVISKLNSNSKRKNDIVENLPADNGQKSEEKSSDNLHDDEFKDLFLENDKDFGI
jgi:hypothetical protein